MGRQCQRDESQEEKTLHATDPPHEGRGIPASARGIIPSQPPIFHEQVPVAAWAVVVVASIAATADAGTNGLGRVKALCEPALTGARHIPALDDFSGRWNPFEKGLAQLDQGAGLHLANALLRQPQLAADLLQCPCL